ncbi:glycolate oxidase subunit GlcE [Chelatococcus sp. GCM10030263]|uniref:glycolate oxidase subunit GlcE n=1 Tax=Chelatococcus sp. GCM10030263 TaxID=3273387 RepID=UPI003606BB33
MNALIPGTEAEAAGFVVEAARVGTPLTIRGGGTKARMGRAATQEMVLSSNGLTGITLYEPAELVVAARAGTPLHAVEQLLGERGQELSFEPPDLRGLLGATGEPTVGGLAAANLSGPRRIMAGACRDSLIGIRAVNGRGESVKSGGRVMKNVTGLDLVKLLAGSWGTLAFLTEVTFKVLPKPERRATLVFTGLDDRTAVAVMAAALGSPFEVSGAAHLPSGIGDRASRTYLRTEGFAFSVRHRVEALQGLLQAFGRADLLDDDAASAVWQGIRDVTAFVGSDDVVWRISVAPSRGPDMGEALAAIPDARWFYDWGGGLIWAAVPAVGDVGAATIRQAVAAGGGHATLVRAPAEIRSAVPVFQPLAEPLMRLTHGIKQAFDPAGIFERGRMYEGL